MVSTEEKKPDDGDYSVAPDPDQPAGVYDLSTDGEASPEDVYKQILDMRGEALPAEQKPLKPKLRGVAAPVPTAPADPAATAPPAENWETKYNEANERHLRALADLDNLRKRQQKQAVDQRKYGHEGAVREVLPVLDNLERALQHAPNAPSGELEKFIEGTRMIVQQFFAALDRLGVKPIPAVGQPFDPAVHEAIQEVPSADVPPGHVTMEMTKGYVLYDRVLRPAKVVISAGSGSATGGESSAADPSKSDGPN